MQTKLGKAMSLRRMATFTLILIQSNGLVLLIGAQSDTHPIELKDELPQKVSVVERGDQPGLHPLDQRTYESGGLEHAIISLQSGERIIVSGGSGGIQFGNDLERVLMHTHPTN
jgi:hypothetical protein